MLVKTNSDDISRLWSRSDRVVWLCSMCAGCASVYSVRTVMSLCSVAISNDLKWNKAQTGAVMGSFYWGYALTQILGGYLGDRYGGDVIMVTAAVAWGLLGFWTPVLPYFTSSSEEILVVMVIARVIMGAFQGVHYPCLTSLLCARVSEEDRAFSYAASSAGTYMGVLLCGSIGSVLLEWYGWSMPFYATGTISMMWVLFMKYNLMLKQRRKDAILSVHKLSSSLGRQKPLSVPWLMLFRKASFWAIIVAHVCVMNAWVILSSWSPTYFHEKFPGAKGWVFNVVPWVLGIVFKITSGVLADRLVSNGYSVTITRKVIEGISCTGCGLLLFSLSYATTYEQALLRMTLAIGFIGFHSGAVMVNPQDIAPQYAGSVFGMMNTVGSIPGFVGVYLAGLTLEATGSWSAVFNQAGVVVLFGGAFYMFFGSGRKIV